jgi:hypothetical protein
MGFVRVNGMAWKEGLEILDYAEKFIKDFNVLVENMNVREAFLKKNKTYYDALRAFFVTAVVGWLVIKLQ